LTLRRILATVAAVVVVLGVFVAGVVVGGHPQATGLTQLRDPLRGFLLGDSGQDLPSQVLDELRRDYYEPVDEKVLEQSSVEAIIKALGDPYTTYLDPAALEALREHNDGTYSGVGLELLQRDEDFVVVRVFPDTPAAEAGLRPGDRIVAVDGKPVAGKAIEEVVAQVRGKEGTTVRITTVRGKGTPREETYTREEIHIPAVDSRLERSGGRRIGYVRLEQFTRGSADATRAAVQSLREKGAHGLVLDLRGDPGGLVDEAIGVAGVFLPSNSPVVTTEGLHSPRKTYTTSGSPVAGDLPLIVLVDRGSASASEIVAGALRDDHRGTLVGERTFGKALVQSTRNLRDGGALKLTTARYLTPSGYDLLKRGLPPALKAVDDPATAKDEALQRALALAAGR
jgi:carboxyl-terminal processing protease